VASRPVASPAALDLGLARASSGAPERTVVGTTPPPSASDPADPLQSVAPSVAPSAGNDGGGPSSNQPFAGGVLVADRANHRIVVVDNQGSIVWRFPAADSLPRGWASVSADDAFIAPDGRSIVANDETHETIVRIDIATRRVVWTYGRYGHAGRGPGELHTPDDAYPLANGDIVVADIENCRVLQIAPDRSIVHQWGRTGVCTDHPPTTFARPNGDTPLPDGGLLITEIAGSRVVRLAPDGHVVFDVHVPVAYPSDAQLDASGNVVVADYSPIGQVVAVDPRTGRLRWRWRFTSGVRRLDHPSLATPLDHGLVSVNDDFRQRLIVIDPSTMRIVWQYGRTDRAGRGRGMLSTPDGHQPIPAGVAF
jgi:outer membrane protein assembly factor BamB